MLYCYETKHLPHKGGLMDQPSTFVRLLMHVHYESNARDAEETHKVELEEQKRRANEAAGQVWE